MVLLARSIPGHREILQALWHLSESGKKAKEVPLIRMPIINEPIRWIAIDIVGPLPNTIKGNQYILVVCVYAMRYPEAFILWMFTAPTVAEKLIKCLLATRYQRKSWQNKAQFCFSTFAEALRIAASQSNQDQFVPSADRWISWTFQAEAEVNA